MITTNYKNIPFSYLMCYFSSDSTTSSEKAKISEEINKRLYKAGFRIDVVEEIKQLECDTIFDFKDITIMDSNELQNFMNFNFYYVFSGRLFELLISELIAIRSLPTLIKLEIPNIDYRLKNLNQDINKKRTLEKVRRILFLESLVEYEDIYEYFFDMDPFFARHKSKIDGFIRRETALLTNMFEIKEKLAAGIEMIDYETDFIKPCVDEYVLPESRLVRFINRE